MKHFDWLVRYFVTGSEIEWPDGYLPKATLIGRTVIHLELL